jgi:tetratricopeptide (TPR) repeat protein
VGGVAGVPAQAAERVKNRTAILVLLLLASACFSLATILQPRAAAYSQNGQDNALKVLFGDGRRIFAQHFFVKADIYFHSGYYPSIFYQGSRDTSHMSGKEEHHDDHEAEADFLGKPKDWIDRFGRNFIVTEHTHLENGNEREILPWLKLSAELDPQKIDSYTVAAYWLANHLGKPAEAEKFLREGLRANPDSYEILFALGEIYSEKYHDTDRARNVWELAVRRWNEQQLAKKGPDKHVLEQMVVNLARLEENEKRYAQAIAYLEVARQISPAPQVIQKQIDDLRQRLAATATTNSASPL